MLSVIGVKNYEDNKIVYEFTRSSDDSAPTAADFVGLANGSVCHVIDDGDSAITLYDEYYIVDASTGSGSWLKIGDKEAPEEPAEQTEG